MESKWYVWGDVAHFVDYLWSRLTVPFPPACLQLAEENRVSFSTVSDFPGGTHIKKYPYLSSKLGRIYASLIVI